MEPLAPGTEDDPLYSQVSRRSKKETAEEQALSKQVLLRNGRYDTIFELNYVQGTQIWYCRICNCPVLGKLFNHEIGKRHKANLERFSDRTTESDVRDTSDASGRGGREASIVVAPGEPLPPGFEGENEKVTMIQDRLDGLNSGPLVGLEYLLELLDYDPSKEPSYLCILCDIKGDPRTILTHLSSYKHQVMYLQKHFPTVHRHIAPYMVKAYKRNWQSGLEKIAAAIESTFGRLKPMPVEAGKFDEDRMKYIEIIAKGKHFNELSGCTFEHVVTKEELTKVHEEPRFYDSNLPFRKAVVLHISKRKSTFPPMAARPMKRKKPPLDVAQGKKRSLSPLSDISSSDLEDFDLDNSDRPLKPSTSQGRSPSPSRKEGPMPWQKANYRRSKQPSTATSSEIRRDEKSEKMKEFIKLANAIDSDMDQVLKKHKQNPEKHPKYNEEWKKFRNSRYKELQTRGKNAATHDFKPEWIEFWNKRMLELHQEEIKAKKLSLRKRLDLLDEATPISFKTDERRKLTDPAGSDNEPIPTTAQQDSDSDVIVIDDNDDDSVCSYSYFNNRGPSRTPLRKRDRSPQFRRRSKPVRRPSSPSPRRRSIENISPTPLRASPPTRRYSVERSPEPDRFGVSRRGRSKDRSKSRGRSRELSWERERHRDYDDKHSRRLYRSRRTSAPWDSPPLSRERLYAPMDPYAPPKVMRDVTREPVHCAKEYDNEDVNVVGVLRLLTALEEKLGSLGPKVIELLGQALAMEKKTANSSEELLGNEMNCVLFETVKEKLKGQLQAGLVDRIKEKAFKIAIMKTASLIHMAGQRKKQKEVELPKRPMLVPGIGTVDKGKISRQIANALIAQGKTDVTQEELEQLISTVVDIAEATKNSAQPMTTATFLEQMGNNEGPVESEPTPQVKSTEDSPKKDQDNQTTNLVAEQRSSKIEEEQDTSNASLDKSTVIMEGLSDSDLQTLLQNFKDLSTEEQYGLINYLKKLETDESERVEKLKIFVNLMKNQEEKNESRFSPFSNPVEGEAKGEDTKEEKLEQSTSFVDIDSEEEEYYFEDVAKAASQEVIEKEMGRKRMEEETIEETDDKILSGAKALITSLVNSLTKGTAIPPVSSLNAPASSSSAPPSISNFQAGSSNAQPSSSNTQISSSNTSSSDESKQPTAPGKINILSIGKLGFPCEVTERHHDEHV